MENIKELNLTPLSEIENEKIDGGGLYDDADIATGYPGQSLVNFIWTTLKAAYQHGYDDKLLNVEPCK